MNESSLDTEHGSISLLRDGPRAAPITVVLAPGAGADMRHPFMDKIAQGLAAHALSVVRFNFVYAERGKKAPDRQPVLEATYRAVIDEVRPKGRLVLGGKSMGGRIASHVVAEGVAADGLLFLGYPLHPPGKPERIRDEHLRGIETPMLFVEGTRDPFCPLETLERVRKDLSASTDVAVIADGDHSFRVPKSSGRSTEDAWNEVVDAAGSWLGQLSASV